MSPKYLLIVSKEHQHHGPPPPELDPYPSAVLADSPVAYWRLGEASGVTAADEVGSNVGTYQNTPTLGVTGALLGDSNTAVRLDGATEYISVADNATIDQGNGPLSWELWVKLGALVVGSGTGARLMIKGDGAPTLQIADADGSVLWYANGVDLAVHSSVAINDTTTWHHIVGTKNGTTWKLYIDGDDATVTDGTPSTSSTASALEFGRHSSGVQQLNGSLDEIAIYNVALTAGQVAAHYSAATT